MFIVQYELIIALVSYIISKNNHWIFISSSPYWTCFYWKIIYL